MQYTVRNIPALLDKALRRAARERGASLNDVALDALARGAGVADDVAPHRSLRDLAGLWRDDPEFDDALREQDTIDARIWR